MAFITTVALTQPALRQQRVYGCDNVDDFASMCIAKDGGVVLGGYSSASVPATGNKTARARGGRDYWIVKQSKTGNKKWDLSFGGINDDELTDMKATADSGYILTGISYSSHSGNKTQTSRGQADYWIIKINKLGSIIWQQTIGGAENDKPYSVDEIQDSGYIVACYSYSDISGDKTENYKGRC